jgi:hypothetical protein
MQEHVRVSTSIGDTSLRRGCSPPTHAGKHFEPGRVDPGPIDSKRRGSSYAWLAKSRQSRRTATGLDLPDADSPAFVALNGRIGEANPSLIGGCVKREDSWQLASTYNGDVLVNEPLSSGESDVHARINATSGATPKICITRFKLYASTCRLISVLTRGSVLVKKCVLPIQAFSVPKGCSTV